MRAQATSTEGPLDTTPPPERRRLSRQVVDQFIERLARGELAPGDRLPPERQLATSFGVGRNSAREAIRELELLGLVTSRQGDGTYVAQAGEPSLLAPLRGAVALSSSTSGLREIMEFRRAIEPPIAALAATNLDREHHALLRDALTHFDDSLDRPRAARAADTNFHFAIARATGNTLIVAVQRTVIESMAALRDELTGESYDRSRRATRGHREIYDAIVARDTDAAQAAMAKHLVDVTADLDGRGADEVDAIGRST
jgi:GntR family transcriptional regulator, transcriptional repressor for pyruvate dehydrogenase complex